jgi:hypothetical protein
MEYHLFLLLLSILFSSLLSRVWLPDFSAVLRLVCLSRLSSGVVAEGLASLFLLLPLVFPTPGSWTLFLKNR